MPVATFHVEFMLMLTFCHQSVLNHDFNYMYAFLVIVVVPIIRYNPVDLHDLC